LNQGTSKKSPDYLPAHGRRSSRCQLNFPLNRGWTGPCPVCSRWSSVRNMRKRCPGSGADFPTRPFTSARPMPKPSAVNVIRPPISLYLAAFVSKFKSAWAHGAVQQTGPRRTGSAVCGNYQREQLALWRRSAATIGPCVDTGGMSGSSGGRGMRDVKRQSSEYMPAEQLLLHRAATTPSHRCCDYRAMMGARLLATSRERCLQNDAGGLCVAPPRIRSRRISE
jgi:hypothetical protein